MSNKITRDDRRYTSSNDTCARMIAWAHGTLDMGGWTGMKRADFVQAIQDDYLDATGLALNEADIIIKTITPACVDATGEWEAEAEAAVASAVSALRSKLAGYDKACEYVTYGVHVLEHADGEFQASLALYSERLEHSDIYTQAHRSEDIATLVDPTIPDADIAGSILGWFDEDWFKAVT